MIPKKSWHGMSHEVMDMDMGVYPNKCFFCQIKNLAEGKDQMLERKK